MLIANITWQVYYLRVKSGDRNGKTPVYQAKFSCQRQNTLAYFVKASATFKIIKDY
jgi:hypothetical protein